MSQNQKIDEVRPVVYTSKALNLTEQRYPQTERESLALYEIRNETLSDPYLCSIIQSVNTNFGNKKLLPTFYKVRNDPTVKDSILLKSNRLVTQKLLRKRI